MTVVLWDINVNKRRKNNNLGKTDATNWTLHDYYHVAQRCIGAFAIGPLAKSMLRNEDAISFVAEHLMYAAFRWDCSGGRTLRSYLNQCAIWSIMTWLTLVKKSNRYPIISINEDAYTDSRTKLYEIIQDKNSEIPDQVIMGQEQSDNLMNVIDDACLTERQQHCLDAVYIQGQRPSEVARELGVSRQAVDQCLNNGVNKIRIVINDQNKEEFFA